LGNIAEGRPHLGNQTRLEVYRLMQFSLRDIIEKHCGTEAADTIFFEAGYLAGSEFYRNLVRPTDDFNHFVKELQELLRALGIGILRVEEADLEKGSLVLTVSEDLDCSGLPELEFEICKYDEGFIAALIESYTGKKFLVKEVDCWCTGDRTCRFSAQAVESADGG
jgi:predicted hydrocarbon binding protein